MTVPIPIPLARAVALLAAAVLCACSGGMPSVTVRPITVGTQLAATQVVHRGLGAMPRTLDPSLSTDTTGQEVIDDLFQGLTTLDAAGKIVPGVAQSWEVSPDGKTWTFHLRPNARWSNGDPVTAQDFVYAWRREVDPKTAAEYAGALSPIVNALAIATGKAPVDSLGVTAADPLTLRVSLTAPTPYLLALLADNYMQPLHRATIERYGESWTRPGHMVSDGPFALAGLVIGDRITLVKNPHFWDAAHVRLTRVVYYPLDNDAAQLDRYLAGDLQFTDGFNSSQYPWLKSHLGRQVMTGPYFGTAMLAFDVTAPPFAHNRDLRLALSMAIDRKILAEKLSHGLLAPAYQLTPPLAGYHPPDPPWASWPAARRHAEARRLYAAAGYSAAHPLHVELDYPTAPAERDFFDALAAMWRINLGADIEPYNEEFRVLQQNEALHKTKFFWNAWIGDFPDPFTFLQLYQTGFQQNESGYSNPAYDALLDEAIRQTHVAARYRYFEAAQALLNADAPYIAIYFYATTNLVKPYLKGVEPNIEGRNLSRYMYVLEHEGN
jgi:oligopeptide transport system substrate-binding protein